MLQRKNGLTVPDRAGIKQPGVEEIGAFAPGFQRNSPNFNTCLLSANSINWR